MAYCINCGQELQGGAKFCAYCGKAANDNNSTSQRKTVYEGEIHKCPNCGNILDAYEAVCESCGYERRGSETVRSVRELQIKLENLYSKRPFKKTNAIFTQAINNDQLTNIDEEIANLIKTFSIPNNKEDIMEFVILASSNIDTRYQLINPAQREISDAWLTKFEQAYQKAKLTFGNSQEFINIHLLFESKHREIKKQKIMPLIITVSSLFLTFGIVFLVLFLTGEI